jgi:lactoylglutathione lyase
MLYSMRFLPYLLLAATLFAQARIERPKVLGIAHVAVYVSDLAKARAFYEGLLGFGEPFTLPKPDGSVSLAFVKINDHQYLELFNEDPKDDGRLSHISIYTDDADRMRSYLASRGVAVPAAVPKGRTGNKNFNIKDPDGHTVEVVEYQAESWTAREAGKFMPATRVSDRIMHVGVLVGNLEAAIKFYGGILGFHEFWRGSAANSKTLSWVNMRAPDGDDYIEFILYDTLPAPDRRGTANHICLVVPDMAKAVAMLEAQPARKDYTRQIATQTGINRKRQANLYDPDGTRVELMEADTIDGKPVPPSTLPPPR